MRAIQLYNGYKVSFKLLKEEWLSWYVAYLCNIKYLSEVACKSLILKKLHVASFTLLLAKAIVCVCKQILQFFAYSSKHQNIWHFTFDILYLYKFSNYLSHFQNCSHWMYFKVAVRAWCLWDTNEDKNWSISLPHLDIKFITYNLNSFIFLSPALADNISHGSLSAQKTKYLTHIHLDLKQFFFRMYLDSCI